MKDFDELEDDEFDYWMEAATDFLVERGFLPFSDEVWTSDKYLDLISAKAQELYEESLL